MGLTFRMFGSQVTFLSAHFEADKTAMSGYKKRIQDSQSILRDLIVDYDDIGCDLQVCCYLGGGEYAISFCNFF